MAQVTPPTSQATRYFTVSLVAATWLLLFVGAMVTSTNSGLSVPDWPTTFGQNMFLYPLTEMKGGIFFEHGHRLFASLIGFMALVNAFFLGGRSKDKVLRYTSYFALILVSAQGVLGGLTVRMQLPMPVSAAHGGMAQLFFLTTLFMAVLASKAWNRSAQGTMERFAWGARGVSIAALFLALGYAQILIGAVMRHSYAGLAIPTFPMAFGGWWPSFWNFGMVMHVLHTRILPLVLTVAILFVLRASWNSPHVLVRRGARALLCFFIAQVTLGAFVIWTFKAPTITSIHVATAAGVLGSALFILIWAGRLGTASAATETLNTGHDTLESKPRFEGAPA
jgi:heme a synthase